MKKLLTRYSTFLLIFRFATSQNLTDIQRKNYENFQTDQKRLVADVFRDYDPNISGIYTLKRSSYINRTLDEHPPVLQLKITLQMLKLVNVVEVEEKVTFLFDYSAEYVDFRIKWDPNKYGGISYIYVPQNKIWMPEITIADAQDVVNFENDQQKVAWVVCDGTVGYYVSVVASVICSLDVYKFPMDEHTCGVDVLYHAYLTDEYEIKSIMETLPKPLSQLGNGEWQVTSIGVDVQNINVNLSSINRFEAKIKRNPGFYISLVIIPAFSINILSIVALFMNLDDLQAKISIGLTNIMAMTFVLAILAADLPKTKTIPRLDFRAYLSTSASNIYS